MEIERKWLLKKRPDDCEDLTLFEDAYIEQSYISIEPEVRIRKRVNSNGDINYKLTIKSNGTLSREEVNIDITDLQYENLLKLAEGKPITKDIRNYMTKDGKKLETSIVDKELDTAFIYAEIEFESEEEALKHELYLDAVDVTTDNYYKMKNYWLRTRN